MRAKNTFSKIAVAVALSVGLSTAAMAQSTTSSIKGSVATESGTIYSNATITIIHTPSGTASTATTNENGSFSARGLRVGGPYTIVVTGDGFAPVQVDDVYLSLDQALSLPVTVESSTQTEVIAVIGSATATAGFSNDGLSTSLGLEALNQVASIDRDITDAAAQNPFAAVNFANDAKALTIAGANNRFNSLTVDGVALNDRFGLNDNGFPTQRSPISFDAIESLSILTAPFDVEYNGFTGGTVNAVTKSGTNEFHGSFSYFTTDDSLIGDKSRDDNLDFTFEEETFVATLGGPIIKDKLFFFVAYDTYEETAPLRDGPVGSGALNIEPNITLDDVAQVRQIVSDVWGFDIGGFEKAPAEDEKILANIDWNINDDHRAKFTYLSTDGNTIREQRGNNFTVFGDTLGASSAWYDRSEKIESYIAHVFSDWTADFSTQFKIASTSQKTGQNSLNGAEFPNFAVFLREVDGDSTYLSIGPDRFRHGNELSQDFLTVKFAAEYVVGDHILKAGFEREEVDVNNLFAQNSEGSYAFDSIEDLRNATASELLYNNAVTNNENDLRAIWGYNSNSLYVQDSWDVNPYLVLDFGLRYDWFESEGSIRENQNFVNRYGYSNTTDIDGLDLVLPRFSFEWLATDDITVRGGIGRFSGGSPAVWISNSYSNDGVISDSSNASGVINVPTTPDASTGQYIPQDVLNTLATKATDGSVNALSPDFEIPTTWKFSLGAAYYVDLPVLGDGWLFSADFLYNKLENSSYWFDQRCVSPLPNVTAPDGRGVYDCAGAPEAIVIGSFDDGGKGQLIALSATNDWETEAGNFDMFFSYTNADVQDIGYGTEATATSNYSDFAAFDRQQPSEGISNFQTEHLFKLRFNWSKEFFSGYESKVSMFATRRSGQPYSYTFDENNACVLEFEGGVFGGIDSRGRQGRCARESRHDNAGHLFYVPSGPNDPLFSSASFGGDAATQQAFFDYINNSELAQYAGGIAPRNGDNSSWTTLVNVRFQQELPAFHEDHSLVVTLDIENFGNLLNDDWGRVERTRADFDRNVASAVIDNGQYRYLRFNNQDRIENLELLAQSVWQVQFGINYKF
ncbi:TonB-dependent receptor [Agaribacter marinus]|uniref:Oar protein n=1 Tax=Agaribacter marinus TaxID=1431249 RepID=A0AA37WIJ1_9ALTE|nr:TonB-dependent receptor [Agaribacter marinus]GLR71148.1 Oar protein [Agaribacter marinus]